MHRIPWMVFFLGALALIVGPLELPQEGGAPLQVESAGAAPMGDGTFVPAGVYVSTNMRAVPSGVDTHGSWIGSDAFLGQHETPWYVARPRTMLLVAGYPGLERNSLELEIRRRDGTHARVPFSGPHPSEKWQAWVPSLPEDAVALRVHAVDGSSAVGGWLAFSQPFVPRPKFFGQAGTLGQLIAVTCLALTLLYGPGLLWFHSRPRPLECLAPAILIGPLLLAGLGLLCWIAGGWIAPALLARLGVGGLLLAIGWKAWRLHGGMRLAAELTPILGAGALLVGFAVAKANYSGGPAGELFQHTVSRSLAVGGHSDSRISYSAAQLVAHHFAPFGPEARSYYDPWSFGSRGPLASLVAAPVMLATGAKPPKDQPNQRWRPFDREGFATYRITLIVLASLAAWAAFGVLAAVAAPAWATVGAILVLLTPFFVHELYFTWPKLMAAGLVLASFLFAYRQKPFAAGLVLGVGYLFHPLAILSTPFLGLWVLLRTTPRGWRRFLAPLFLGLGLLLLVGPWQLVGRWHPGAGRVAQEVFLTFFRLADNAIATWPTWWQSRWDNFANTFLPGYLLLGDPTHESVNSIHGPSDRWVRMSFLYWNTLPFALGLPAFALVVAALFSGLRRAPGTVLITWALPTLFLIVYWGAASTGLMRHCGHVLFLSTIVVATWSLSRWESPGRGRALAALFHPICFAWRAGEIALVAFGTTLLNHLPVLQSPFGWNDWLSLPLAAACLIAATILLAKTARALDSAFLNPHRPSQS